MRQPIYLALWTVGARRAAAARLWTGAAIATRLTGLRATRRAIAAKLARAIRPAVLWAFLTRPLLRARAPFNTMI